jgi:hypothetical protein
MHLLSGPPMHLLSGVDNRMLELGRPKSVRIV